VTAAGRLLIGPANLLIEVVPTSWLVNGEHRDGSHERHGTGTHRMP
jgi:hypothetical protein